MLILDAFLRYSGIAMLILIAIMAVRDWRDWHSTSYLVLACLSVGAIFLGYTPGDFQMPWNALIILRLLDVPHLVFIWLFALSLFQPKFEIRVIHWIVGLLYVAPIYWLRLGSIEILPPAPAGLIELVSICSILLILHLCFSTLRGRVDDLLEKRRSARIYFVILIIFSTVFAAMTEMFGWTPGSLHPATLKIASIWPVIVWGTYWMTAFNRPAVSFTQSARPIAKANRQNALRIKLEVEMLENRAFKEMDLTISALATRLGTTQHGLRHLINQGLGYRNFSSFLNSYRIEAVKASFLDETKLHLPILTVALDAGFSSLPPFNRAFKQAEGVTPSEYRRIVMQSR